MGTEHRQPVRVVVLSASLRRGSLNERLARLAEQVIQQQGATAERATMGDFDSVWRMAAADSACFISTQLRIIKTLSVLYGFLNYLSEYFTSYGCPLGYSIPYA